jgi:hypothetical protein
MDKTALHDIQKGLNIVNNQIDAVYAETKWAALEPMLESNARVVALAQTMAKAGPKTVTRKVPIKN